MAAKECLIFSGKEIGAMLLHLFAEACVWRPGTETRENNFAAPTCKITGHNEVRAKCPKGAHVNSQG